MQLDKTRIVIKERGMLEVMDLALQVLRSYTVNFASSRPDETREAAADASWLGHAGNEVAYLLGRLGFGPLAVAFLIGMAPFAAFNAWAARLKPSDLATCAITEMGFIRVSSAALGFAIGDSRKLLQAFRVSGPPVMSAHCLLPPTISQLGLPVTPTRPTPISAPSPRSTD